MKPRYREYSTIEVHGHHHIISDIDMDERMPLPLPDYLHTGKALCGILQPGETLGSWMADRSRGRSMESEMIMDDLIKE